MTIAQSLLDLVADLTHVHPILALESIFPWVGEFNTDGQSSSVQCVEGDVEDTRLVVEVQTRTTLLRSVTTNDDNLNLVATVAIGKAEHLELRLTLAAMGLVASKAVDHEMVLKPTERGVSSEVLSDRLSAIDGLRMLIRKLKCYATDQSACFESIQKLLAFAKEWNDNQLRILSTLSSTNQKQQTALEEKARSFAQWGVPGLRGVVLHYDPRGSAMSLLFEGDPNEFRLCAIPNWEVGTPIPTLNAKQLTALPSASKRAAKEFEVKPTKIKPEILKVLEEAQVERNKVFLKTQLSPKLYSKVNEVLCAIGGKWDTHKSAHVFAEDAQAILQETIQAGAMYTAKDFEFFETQPAEVSRVIDLAGIVPGMKVMEPSAGRGAMAMAAAEIVGKDNVVVHEFMPRNAKHLRSLGFHVHAPKDFLLVEPEQMVDVVIMNPPFSSGRDIAHIRHAMDFLKPGGRLVAIASTSWRTTENRRNNAFVADLNRWNAKVYDIDSGAFKAAGTMVATTLIVIDKDSGPTEAPKSASRDLAPAAAGQLPATVEKPVAPVPTRAEQQVELF